MNSQAGYELAIQGPIRPVDSKIPVIYGIKCVYFEPPYFTIGKLLHKPQYPLRSFFISSKGAKEAIYQ